MPRALPVVADCREAVHGFCGRKASVVGLLRAGRSSRPATVPAVGGGAGGPQADDGLRAGHLRLGRGRQRVDRRRPDARRPGQPLRHDLDRRGANNDGTVFEIARGSSSRHHPRLVRREHGVPASATWWWTATATSSARPRPAGPTTRARCSRSPTGRAPSPPSPPSTAPTGSSRAA